MSAAGAYTATVQAISNNPAYLNGPASDSSTPMTVLNKVAKPTWTTDTGIINWVDVDNETSYTVTLLKDGAPLETVTKTAGSISHPFGGTIALNGAGNYSVTVQAINSGTDYIDGLASDASEERTVVQLDLGADPWWGGITGHVIYWNNIDNETGYQVILKKDGNVVECQNIESTTAYWYDFDYRMNGVTGSFTVDVKALGNGTNYANSIPRTSAAHVH
ncbi:hypothetical protein [Syntrophomonas palmitatica]|uniref:hypothetical protein n=1 Tax=Syntrophomonas palmitatica TaxID=402877 RepID=UPI0006D04D40|nr:hypothetical protein [Syntrophomonas palmitatica]